MPKIPDRIIHGTFVHHLTSMARNRQAFGICLLVSAVLLGPIQGPVHAEEILVEMTLFGPEAFVRDPGEPVTITREFQVQKPARSYLVRVRNGSAKGEARVSSAVITLNGTAAVKQSDFNQNIRLIERPVTLLNSNQLGVRLESAPDSRITVTIVGYYAPEDVDDDRDGFTEREGDCDDLHPDVHPWAPEICDLTDNDCDGEADQDCIHAIELTAGIESGTPPLETTLRVHATFSIADASIGYTGPAEVEFPDNAGIEEYPVVLREEGVYTFTAEAEDAHGDMFNHTLDILVLNREQVDALIRARWDGMKRALADRDPEAALDYFLESSRERYQGIFTALSDLLPAIAHSMQDIEMISVENQIAEYRIKKIEKTGEVTYYIYFVLDEDGIWKVQQF